MTEGSITLCIMDKHQAPLEETLVGDRMGYRMVAGHLEAPRGPRRPRECFKCAVALIVVVGLLIVALITGFISCYFFLTPSTSNQEAPPLRSLAKVIKTSKLGESDALGRHHIFTADTASVYLIYGWVTFLKAPREPLELIQIQEGDVRTLKKMTTDQTEIFFFTKVTLINNATIRLSLPSSEYTDNCFHVYEL